jgi:NADH dehydrogenase FAD-containing subunit
VPARGSRSNDFAIPGLAERAISLYSAADAERVEAAVNQAGATAQRPPQIPTSSGAWRP